MCQHPPKNKSNASLQRLRELIRRYWQWRLDESPEFATTCSVYDYDNRLTVITVESIDRQLAKCREFLAELPQIDMRKIEKIDRMNLILLKDHLQTFVSGHRWRQYGIYNAVNFLENVVIDFTCRLTDSAKLTSELDFDKYIQRLTLVEKVVDSNIEMMGEAGKQGTTLHAVSVEKLVKDLKTVADTPTEDSVLYEPFIKKLHQLRSKY